MYTIAKYTELIIMQIQALGTHEFRIMKDYGLDVCIPAKPMEEF